MWRMPVYSNMSVNRPVIDLSNLAFETSFHTWYTILYVFHDIKEYICQIIFLSKLFVFFFCSFHRNLSVFKKHVLLQNSHLC